MRYLGLVVMLAASCVVVGCGNEDDSGDTGEPVPVATGTWPDVDCGGGTPAAVSLSEIESQAQVAQMFGIVQLVNNCRSHSVGNREAHCQRVANARTAASSGDWQTCATELDHSGSGDTPPPPTLAWPNVDCGGQTAAEFIAAIIDAARNAEMFGVVQLAERCGSEHITGNQATHCTHLASALAAAASGDWQTCATELDHSGSGGVVEPVAGDPWPNVDCGGHTAEAALRAIIDLATQAGMLGVVQLAKYCTVDHSTGDDPAMHCQRVDNARTAAEAGEWQVCATELDHSGSGGVPQNTSWPDTECGDGRTARSLLVEIQALATDPGRFGIVVLAEACKRHATGDREAHCAVVKSALAAAKIGDWAACATELHHDDDEPHSGD